MQYIDTQAGAYPLTLADLRSAHPLTIFFEPFEGDDRYMPVAPVAPPEHDAATHKAVETEPVEDGGQWRQAWSIVPLTPQEIEGARLARVPAAVTMRQARLALLGAGLLSSIDAAIAALPSPQKEAAAIEWEYSHEVQRHNGFVSALAPALGLTQEQTDALFVQAAML